MIRPAKQRRRNRLCLSGRARAVTSRNPGILPPTSSMPFTGFARAVQIAQPRNSSAVDRPCRPCPAPVLRSAARALLARGEWQLRAFDHFGPGGTAMRALGVREVGQSLSLGMHAMAARRGRSHAESG